MAVNTNTEIKNESLVYKDRNKQGKFYNYNTGKICIYLYTKSNVFTFILFSI